MQISLMWSIIFSSIIIVAYYLYIQYIKRKNQSLLDISKQSDWIEPILEGPKKELLEEKKMVQRKLLKREE